MRERLRGVRLTAVLAVQCGVSAGLSWFVARDVLGHPAPFFAPISAVLLLVAGAGQRLRRAVEMVLGVALGIAVGDALIILVGVGPVQIAAVVTLAILTTVILGGGPVAMGQAASSGVLVATLSPPAGGIYYGRFIDALVGGATGIIVMLVLPFNPLTRVRRAADAALTALADALRLTATALRDGDSELAERALSDLRAGEHNHATLRESLSAGRETATLAPLRWPSRPALSRYVDGAVHIDRATRNIRVMQRRTASLVRDAEPAPPDLPTAVDRLADAVTALRRDLATGGDSARTPALDAARAAGSAYAEGVGFSGSVVVAQIRSAAVDVLVASGLDRDEAVRAVRAAGGQR